MVLNPEIEEPTEQEGQGPSESILLKKLVVLATHRKFLAIGILAVALFTAVNVLVMPVTYTATAVILTPQNESGSALALLGQLGGGLGSLASLGSESGIKSPAETFLSVLNSRTVADELIQRFDLRKVYKQRAQIDTRKALARHTHIESKRGSTINISVEDSDAQRATTIANGYIDELYRVNQHLALTTGSQRRLFLEQQLDVERKALADAEVALQAVQQKTGVIQLAGQAEITLRSIAQIRAAISAKEVQLQLFRTTVTDQNLDVIRLESEIAALREQLRKADSSGTGSDDSSFVPAGKIPEAGLEYLRRVRDLRYHETLFEMLAKQYEVARIDEAKAPPLIQVLDKAVVPDRRTWPPRTLLVVLSAILSGILLSGLVLLKENWTHVAKVEENERHLNALRAMLLPAVLTRSMRSGNKAE